MTILIIDDEPGLRQTVSLILADEGYDVATASDGEEGLSRALELQPDMILCDVGAEYEHYAADITRTFPVDGHFNPEQRKVYELVLRAQEAAAKLLKPGVMYEDCQRAADQVFRDAGMIDAFWHGLGHFVGLEVHDTGDQSQPLPEGAVVTIEPGLYYPGIGGVRLEDMACVTRNSPKNLTKFEKVLEI